MIGREILGRALVKISAVQSGILKQVLSAKLTDRMRFTRRPTGCL